MCDSSKETAPEASIGVDTLLRDSDTAMYHAKAAGKGQYALFDEKMRERALNRLYVEGGLRKAIQRHRLRVAYQPIVNLHNGVLEGFEGHRIYSSHLHQPSLSSFGSAGQNQCSLSRA
jgi:predicted signal transduction protein with EAL and GGDEF domain